MRLRVTLTPVLSVWLPRTSVIVSLPLMSVVGDTSERAAPKKLAKPLIVVSGIEFSNLPPLRNSCWNWKPYVSRFQRSPSGGIRWATHAPVAFASLIKVGLIIHECESWIEVPGRWRRLGIVGT